MSEKFRPEKFKIYEVEKGEEIERKENIEIPQLLVRTPVEDDPLYKAMTTGYKGTIGDPSTSIYGYPRVTFKKRLKDNIVFVLPRPEFKQTKDYEKVIVEIGSGIPPVNATMLDKIIFSKGKGYPNEVAELCKGVFEGRFLYVGIDLGIHGYEAPRKQLSKISRELLKHEIYKKENIVFIGADAFHILPFIKNNSVDAIINYSAGDVPVPNLDNVYSKIISASYLRIIKPTGKFFADNIADAPKQFFEWPEEYKNCLYERRKNPLDEITENGVFLPIKKLER